MGGHIRGRVWHRFLSRRAYGEPGTSPGESRPPSQDLALLVPPAHHTLERSRARITEQPCWISFQIQEQTQTINDSRQMYSSAVCDKFNDESIVDLALGWPVGDTRLGLASQQ